VTVRLYTENILPGESNPLDSCALLLQVREVQHCRACNEHVESERQLRDHLATRHAPAELSSLDRGRAARHRSEQSTGGQLLQRLPSLPLSACILGVLLCVGLLGVVGWASSPASGQSGPTEVSNWTDLGAIDDSQATLGDDYVLVNELNRSTAGYETVVLNQTATEFSETVFFPQGESQAVSQLTRTPVAELLSNDAGLNLTLTDPANGTIERENTNSATFAAVTYATPTEQFVRFDPVGGSSEPFTGSFDGQGNAIRDLVVTRPTESTTGVFGSSEGTVEDVTLANTTVTGFSEVGGLVGFNSGTVTSASASGAVNGSISAVGGLVGQNDGSVTNASASVVVGGSADEIGGVVGRNTETGTVTDVSASGAVAGDPNATTSAGGVVGQNDGTVADASASGTVSAPLVAGGLVGQNVGTVTDASASGSVTGEQFVGGFVGLNAGAGTVTDVSASGAVTATDDSVSNAGGLVGSNNGIVTDASANGTVRGEQTVGGLTGRNAGTVTNASASGAVNGSDGVGGLVGSNDGTVTDASARGVVNGSSGVGGLVGDNRGTVANASASGAVDGSSDVGGLVGDNFKSTVRDVFASGAVTGDNGVGGLVGQNRGTVRDAYALGTVDGTGDTGGLVGKNGVSDLYTGTIERTYAAGEVDGVTEVGGLVGRNANGSVNSSYFDNQTTGQSSAIGTATDNGTTSNAPPDGLATTAMQGLTPTQAGGDTMDGLDFARDQSQSNWSAVVAGEGLTPTPQQDGYPILRSLDTAEQLDAQGATGDPGPPALPGAEGPPRDLDGDSRYEDVDGDEEFTIFDVQAFFTSFQEQTVQNNREAFNFDEQNPEDPAVTIFDVQALFIQLSSP